MSRPLRIEYPGAWYHVLNRGRRKEKIFFEEGDYFYFLNILKESTRQFNCEIHGYALMNNHYHILMHTPLGNLSRIMRHIDGVYTQYVNRKYEYDGSLFRGRFKSIIMDSDNYLLELSRYIHMNPYKAGLEEKFGDYPWTSYQAYCSASKRPSWLYVNDVLSKFGACESEAIEAFKMYTQDDTLNTVDTLIERKKRPSMLGGDDFKEKMKTLIKAKKNKIDVVNVPETKKYVMDMSCKELMSLIETTHDLEPGELKEKRRHLLLKCCYVYMSRIDLQKTGTEISEELGGVTASMLTRYYKHACDDIEKESGSFQDIKNMRDVLESIV